MVLLDLVKWWTDVESVVVRATAVELSAGYSPRKLVKQLMNT